jgi:hypothetical protein
MGARGTWGLAALLVLASALALASAAAWLRLEADASRVVRGTGGAFADFRRLEQDFGAPTRDEILVVRAPDLGAPAAFAALEDLVFALQLAEGVRGVVSLFALPGAEAVGSTGESTGEAAPADWLDRLRAEAPLAPQFLSEDRSTTVLIVLPDLTVPSGTRRAALAEVLVQAPPEISPALLGLAELNREISTALLRDIALFLPLSALACLLCCLAIFRTPRAMLVCGLAPALSLLWSFGLLAALGVPLSPLLATVPVVILTLGIADSVHVYHAILRQMRDRPPAAAVAAGLRETLPAVAITSGTTAAAFLSLLWVGSPTLAELAWTGAAGLGLTFLALVLALPPLVGWLHRETAVAPRLRFAPVVRLAQAALARPRPLRLLALGLLAGLAAAQLWGARGFDAMDFLPRDAAFRAEVAALEQALPGSVVHYVIVEPLDADPAVSPAERARLEAAARALYGAAAALPGEMPAPGQSALWDRVVQPEGRGFALPLPAPMSADAEGHLARTAEIEARLAGAGLAEVTTVTGYAHMVSTEVPGVVGQLRVAFYLAVGAVTLAAMLLMRSVRVALAALVPNLIPILGAEAWLSLRGEALSITEAVALTIAFGIAVDDTVHVLNRLRLAGGGGAAALGRALEEAVPPIATTSLILLAGFGTSAFSSLPTAASFCTLAAIATALAFLADLLLFPALFRGR